jgi:hypothetical protein
VPTALKATDGQLTAAYAELGNVHKVGERFGMRGTSAHERLSKLGVVKPMNVFTDEEKERLRRDYNEYAGRGRLHLLAAEMGRSEAFICRQARMLDLTQVGRPRADRDKFSDRTRTALKKHGHPRGMLGKRHSRKTKERISQTSFDFWHGLPEEERIAIAEAGKTSWKAGWREIGGIRKFYRSKWEANYARYLQWLLERGEITAWAHEPETFWFDAIKRGVRSYLPDFRVTELTGRVVFHEVKGWMTPRSKTALKRMAKYHPTIEILLIERRQYTAIKNSVARLIEGWE